MKIYIFSHAPKIDSKLSRNLFQLQNLYFLRVYFSKHDVRTGFFREQETGTTEQAFKKSEKIQLPEVAKVKSLKPI